MDYSAVTLPLRSWFAPGVSLFALVVIWVTGCATDRGIVARAESLAAAPAEYELILQHQIPQLDYTNAPLRSVVQDLNELVADLSSGHILAALADVDDESLPTITYSARYIPVRDWLDVISTLSISDVALQRDTIVVRPRQPYGIPGEVQTKGQYP